MKNLLATIVIFFLFGGILSAQRTTETPGVISYQGIISSHNGAPLANGEYSIIVTLYADAAGTVKVWQDTYMTPVRGGVFNIYLGSGTVSLPASSQMDRALWIGTQVAGGEEMRPLTRLSASPYAINVPDNAITTHKLADGAVTADKVNLDYISGVSVNGKKIPIDGNVLNIQAGKDIEINYDEISRSLVIGSPAGAGAGREKEGKGDRKVQVAPFDAWGAQGNKIDVGTGVTTTATSADWIGTNGSGIDNFNMRVNNTQIMSYQQPVLGQTPNVVGGDGGNSVSANAVGNVIAGGGEPGSSNTIAGDRYNVISGGLGNSILNAGSFGGVIAGGQSNQIGTAAALANYGVIGGGLLNVVTATYGTVGGGNRHNISGVNSTVGGGIGNIISGSEATIAGGDGNQTTMTKAAIGGGYHNRIINSGVAAAIPGGYDLTAQSFGQTVVGVLNIPKGTRTLGSALNNEPIVIVGNGIDGIIPSNAFEVSYNGHSTVFHNTGGATPVIQGSTYTDNVIYAWGSVDDGGGRICDFGVSDVEHLGPGWYQITMDIIDADGNQVLINCGSVTATIISDQGPGNPQFVCNNIKTSQIQNNVFDVYISNRSCTPTDDYFTFKVTGRP